MKTILKVTFASLLLVASAHADQYIYPDPPSYCGQAADYATIYGYWGAYGSDYEHNCRYYHSSGPMCGQCLGSVDSGTLEVKDTVQMEFGFCTQHTWMRGETGSGIMPYYLIMNAGCTTSTNSLWVTKYTGSGC
jgi:hypothetical protein